MFMKHFFKIFIYTTTLSFFGWFDIIYTCSRKTPQPKDVHLNSLRDPWQTRKSSHHLWKAENLALAADKIIKQPTFITLFLQRSRALTLRTKQMRRKIYLSTNFKKENPTTSKIKLNCYWRLFNSMPWRSHKWKANRSSNIIESLSACICI